MFFFFKDFALNATKIDSLIIEQKSNKNYLKWYIEGKKLSYFFLWVNFSNLTGMLNSFNSFEGSM